MSSNDLMQARIRTLRHEAENIISVEMVPLAGEHFPRFEPGSHVDLHLPNGMVRSYSLLNSPDEADRYVFGILSDRASRGGSRYVHEQFRCGLTLPISLPRNHFALDESAAHTALVAGGIGITPILCMYRRLRQLGRDVRLVYCARSRGQAAFLDELATLGGDVTLYFDDEHGMQPFDMAAYLRQQPSGTHGYCCGPGPMLNAFEAACASAGISDVHIERFAADPALAEADAGAKTSYEVELAQSGVTIQVTPGQSLLDAVLEAGVDAGYSCHEGICGACETHVLSGCPDHRDSVLSAAEKASNKVMMICVSGSKSDKLVLDL